MDDASGSTEESLREVDAPSDGPVVTLGPNLTVAAAVEGNVSALFESASPAQQVSGVLPRPRFTRAPRPSRAFAAPAVPAVSVALPAAHACSRPGRAAPTTVVRLTVCVCCRAAAVTAAGHARVHRAADQHRRQARVLHSVLQGIRPEPGRARRLRGVSAGNRGHGAALLLLPPTLAHTTTVARAAEIARYCLRRASAVC
jgi:hypothetical protein